MSMIDMELFIVTDDGLEVPVASSITLNDYAVNKDRIQLLFKNTGDSTWISESFEIVIGGEHFVFEDDSKEHKDSATRAPGSAYSINAFIKEFKASTRYTNVITAAIKDSRNQTVNKTYELLWFGAQKTVPHLSLVVPSDDAYKYPNLMKRNARYRGQRESEKVLNSHQEQVYDIRQNFKDITELTNLQEISIKSWFRGEIAKETEINTFTATKSFNTSKDQATYSLMPGVPGSQFSNVVIQLNGSILPVFAYSINDLGYLVLSRNVLQDGTMTVDFAVSVALGDQRMVGTQELGMKLREMDERLGELERRFTKYESTFE